MSTQTKRKNYIESTQEKVCNSTYPLSITQRQFWLIHQLSSDIAAYNIPLGFRIHGNLDVFRLEKSLNQIIKRHEILRTTIYTVNGKPVQKVAKHSYADFTVKDLRTSLKINIEKQAEEIINAEVVRPFNLYRGPLLRAAVLQVSDDDYIFLTVMHHIITDLHTNDQFADELAGNYNSVSNWAPVKLPKPDHQYFDYVVWQQDWIRSKKFKSMLTYWKEALDGQSGYLNIFTDRPRPPVQSLHGDAVLFGLSKELTEHIKRFSRQHKVSFFITMLTAYIILLHRYSGDKHITVGVPHANRRQSKFKNVMGCFINILPITVEFTDNPNAREVLSRVRKAMFEAHRHQEVTFEVIVKALKLKRDHSYNPIYQFGFTFYPPSMLELEGMAVEPLKVHNQSSKLDMFAEMWETNEGMGALVEYNTDIFDKTTIERFIGNYQKLLESIIADPAKAVYTLPILTDPEKKQLLEEWNSTEIAYPEDSCIPQLFENQVALTPDATAVVYENQELTYQDLSQRANKLANYLRKLGVRPEVLVGVFIDRSIEMVVGLLGILKAGGAYVPLDPDFPKQRIAYMIEDSKALVILTQKKFTMELPETQVKVISLDKNWAEISKESAETPEADVKPENLAYVVYTSGSTGNPKGVMNEHRGIVNRLLWMQDKYVLTESDRVLQKTPFSFDVSVWELFWPLLVGARLVVSSPGIHWDPVSLVQMITEQKITTLHFVPSMLQLFLKEKSVIKCTSLIRVFCSGEALSYDLQERFFERLPVELYNLYGPTEASVDVTFWKCQRGSKQLTVPIGKPVANTKIYILDHLLQPVPIGVTGELHIGGVQVARGYRNRPELTKEKFIPDPFRDKPGARLFKTGDLARYLPDGNIEYIGRNDFQVKIRGLRIELNEIEALLSKHPKVSETIVIARKDMTGRKRIGAYFVSKKNAEIPITELHNFLNDKLPDNMVPSFFIRMKEFPLLQNGKVNRRVLPEPTSTRPDLVSNFVAPRTKKEQIIGKVWQAVLGIDKVGINDNFFDLGGDSLLLVRVLLKLHKQFDNDLKLFNLLEYPNIRSLANYLNLQSGQNSSLEGVDTRVKRKRTKLAR